MGHGPAHEAPGRDDGPGPERAGLGFDPRFDGDRGWRLRPSSPDWPAGEHPGELDDGEPPPEDEDPCAGWVDPEDLDVWLDDTRMAALHGQAAQVTVDAARARAARERSGRSAATAGVAAEDRRGPGMPGSARTYPGEYTSRASGFASGMVLDTAPGCVTLGLFAEEAAGDDDRYPGACDDELAGVICGWDRDQAHAAARKYAAVAEFIRRRPAPGYALDGPAEMPTVWDEFAPAELAAILGESRWAADNLLDVAYDLEVKLPGTKAAFRDGILSEAKAGIIARATTVLDPDEARQAEALVLGRAGTLTPAGLAAAITRAVMAVAPEKAKKRREQAAKEARLERWTEPKSQQARRGKPGGHDPPGSTGSPRFTFTPARRDGPPGGYGTWRLSTGIPGQPDLIISLGPITTDPCDHRHEARGHDPGVTLRHLTQIRNATCTGPGCRRPSAQCDFEHNVPYEAGGRSCLCNADPKCRHDHRLKQHPRWKSEHLADGTIRWTMPSGRHYTTEPTRYPI